MKKITFILGFYLIFTSCETNSLSKKLEQEKNQLETLLNETKNKLSNLEKKNQELIEEKDKKITETKIIKDLTVSIYKVDQGELEGILLIKNNKTNLERSCPIELLDIETSGVNSYVNFKDIDFDGIDEILIETGEPTHMPKGFRVFDYNSLKPKKIFKKTKEHIYIGNSKEKDQFTNIVNVGHRATYKINNKNKTIHFWGACGASCTTIEIYQFKNKFFSLKEKKRIENGITTIE